MDGEAQTVVAGELIHLAKLFGSGTPLVSAETDADNVAALQPDRFFDNPTRFVDSEVPDRVEDP